jgi:ABC-2 type transport system ATP-binding protein
VMGGIIEPSTGTIESRGRIAALLELGAGFHPDLTGRENVFLNASVLGLSRKQTEDRFDEILAFSEIGDFIDTQVKFYSSGMYVRLAFAVAVHTDPDILIVDEVLAVGDEAFQLKCMNKIKSFQTEGRTIILVTHSMGQVQDLCDRVVLLNRGRVVIDDEPNRVVAEFRDILEERRLENAPPATTETLLDEPRIVEATVRAVGRSSGDAFRSGDPSVAEDSPSSAPLLVRPGDDLEIHVRFQHPTGLDDWTFAIQVDNESGQKVYGTTSREVGSRLGRLLGEQSYVARIHDTRFGPGKYFVNVSILDRAGRHLADRPQAVSFNGPANPFGTGSLYATADFAQAE